MKTKAESAKEINVALLLRVSTNKQDTARQEGELAALAAARGWRVVEICKETISGSADKSERTALNRVEALAKAGSISKVLVHEVSRIARRSSIVHQFVEMLEDCHVSLYWHAQSIETLLPSGRRNPSAAIMMSLLAEMARCELETLRERIVSGLENAKTHGTKSGKAIGRPTGSTPTAAFLAKHKDVVKLLNEGQSLRHAAAIAGKSFRTVARVAAARKAA